MGEDEKYQGMGMALLLLRSVQLYLCCLGKIPQMYFQVANGSRLHRYLLDIGFVIYNDKTMISTLKQCKAFWILVDANCIVLRSGGMVGLKKMLTIWDLPTI
jgi:hypothetical protein